MKTETTSTDPEGEISLTFAKGLAVLRAFDAQHQDMSVADIATLLGFTRAATRRLVRTLELEGYVRAERQRYRLTPRSLKLSLGFLQSRSVGHLIGPVLHEESLVIGAPISLALLDGEEAIFVLHAPSETRAGMAGLTVGSSLALTETATGHAILAAMPAGQREKLRCFNALSPDALTVLEAALDAVAADGFATRSLAPSSETLVIAVAAFNAHDDVAGALSIVLPAKRWSDAQIREFLVPHLQRCAKYIASGL